MNGGGTSGYPHAKNIASRYRETLYYSHTKKSSIWTIYLNISHGKTRRNLKCTLLNEKKPVWKTIETIKGSVVAKGLEERRDG